MSIKLINPYIAGAPVTESRMFFGREDVFNWIQNSLSGKYTDHMLVIHGQRRVGKTSVLKQLNNHLPDKYIPVFFDLQGRTHTSIDRFLWWLARETVRVLKQERNIEVPIPNKEDFANDADFFENVFLPGLKPVIGERILLFTFDEFDNLEESEVKEELARPLIDYLRRLIERDDMSFIFSIGSSGRKLENMQADYTEFFKTALYKKISFLSEVQTEELITRPVQGLLEYDPEAIHHIYDLASGHPYFTQLTCHELFAHCQRTDQRNVNDDDVKAILNDVVERGTVNLKFTWDESSDIEKWALASLSHLEKTDKRDIIEFLNQQRVRFSESDLSSGLLHLREKDILTEKNRFVIYLLKIWLQKNRPIDQVREELTEVNPIANRYIEIGSEFKDAGIFDKALDSFREALAISPGNIQAQTNIALTYMIQKMFAKAVEEFENVLLIDDEDIVARSGLCDAHIALGDAALSSGQSKEAIDSYQRVLSINSEHLEARHRMADILQKQAERALSNGKDEEALHHYEEALAYTPEDLILVQRVETVRVEKIAKILSSIIARAEKEITSKNWEKSLSYLSEAQKLSDGEPDIQNRIEEVKNWQKKEQLERILSKADRAEKSGNWDIAISTLGDYLEIEPENEAILTRLKKLTDIKHDSWIESVLKRYRQAINAKNWDLAITVLNEVLLLEPDNQKILAKVREVRDLERKARLDDVFRQINIAIRNKQWGKALDAINQGLGYEPENEALLLKLAEVREARRIARQQATYKLVNISVAAEKWETAIQALNELLVIEPANLEVQKKLSEVQKQKHISQVTALVAQAEDYTKSENFDQAISAWEQYLDIQPADRENANEKINKIRNLQTMAVTYAEAKNAFSNKNYEKTIGLLKEIISQDVNYKDASLLFDQAIESRKERKWWQQKWVKISGFGVIIALGTWAIFMIGSSWEPSVRIETSDANIVSVSSAANIVEESPVVEQEIPEIVTSEHPELLPYHWIRLDSGQFLSRDQITGITADLNNPGVIYVCTQHSGAYKTIDGGLSWQPIISGLERAYITSIIIDPDDSETLYASVDVGGIYKSINGGIDWTPINKGINIETRGGYSQVVMDNQDHQHLYYMDMYELYSTYNGGNIWQKIKLPVCFERSENSNLAINPADGGTIYITEFIGGREKRVCSPGIYQSTDSGENWTLLPMESRFDGIEFQFASLSIDPENPEHLFISSNGTKEDIAPDERLLYGSIDGGANWKMLLSGLCFELISDRNNPETMYCSSMGEVLYSKDQGQSWNTLYYSGDNQSFEGLSILSDGTLMIGSRGILASVDQGKSWLSVDNGIGSDYTRIFVDPDNENNLIIEDSKDNYFISESQGIEWHTWIESTPPKTIEQINVDGYDGYVFQIPNSMKKYFTASSVNETYYYNGSNQLWEYCNSPYYPWWINMKKEGLLINVENEDELWLATDGGGVLHSTNGCKDWDQINSGLQSLYVNTLSQNPIHPDTIYAGTDGGAYISMDKGQSWHEINDGLLGATVIYSVAVDNEGTVFATTPYGIFQLEIDE